MLKIRVLLQGLFRKVCLGQISPSELVKMKSEQYASDELAEWREKTLKKVRYYFYCCLVSPMHKHMIIILCGITGGEFSE